MPDVRPVYTAQCTCVIPFRPLADPRGEPRLARKTYLALRTDLTLDNLPMRRDVEEQLVATLVIDGWRQGAWPSGPPSIWWSVWDDNASAFVACEWPREKESEE